MDVRKKLREGLLIFDGAMGTMLQNMGLKLGELPETLNINSAEIIVEIHKKYIDAGSNMIITNTFGANELKMKNSIFSVEQVIESAVKNAKLAASGKDVGIALDIGPIGELMEPMGTLSFEEAYEIFKRQILQGVKSGVDAILIETMTDLYEVKAAVLAAKENSELPVFCTMSYEENGRTFTGCNITSMVMVLQGLGVDALGFNCSLGPKELEPLVYKLLDISKVPVMVQPNAGLPTIVEGKTVFNITPDEFADYGLRFAERGVRILGGCCGTTDRHIKALAKALNGKKACEWQHRVLEGVCTPTKAVEIEGIRVIGERINPTGKKRFKEALRSGDIDYILREAISQVNSGADILDVNVGLPEIDETKTMVRVIKEIQSIIDVPLQIDSTDPLVIEQGLRIYNGKAIVNSVNGEDKVLDEILPIVKKYGASVVGLTLSEKGIPGTAIERYELAEKIVYKALSYGIPKEDIYIDCLTLTAAAQQKEVAETLKAISMVKEKLGVKTVLGVSNVSFGLPNRELINKTFLAAAVYAGLDLPIINPGNKEMMDIIRASKVLWNEDKGGINYLQEYNSTLPNNIPENIAVSDDLSEIILKGMKDDVQKATTKLLEFMEPLDIVNDHIIPALDMVGEKYEKGKLFLPQLIRSAETVSSSFEIIKERLSIDSKTGLSRGKIILATVKGDIHDIGKNIVKVLLENYNYEVIDLGRDVARQEIIQAAIDNNVKLIGLSALMTTTVKSMEETIAALKAIDPAFVIMAGGAVLTEDYAKAINADYYARDARDALSIAKSVLS